MSSGNVNVNASRLDRILKLWISLWTLVLEEKRHLETVCAVLQRAVFNMKGVPRYKNWAVICELGRSDPLMMMVLSTLDMSKAEDPLVTDIIAAFPLCFATVKCGNGPYPLSVIRAKAADVKRLQIDPTRYEAGYGADHPVSNKGVPDDVPVHGFDKGNAAELASFDGPMLPEELVPFKDAIQGQKISWGGKEFVVLENNIDCEEFYIAPAECIIVDL